MTLHEAKQTLLAAGLTEVQKQFPAADLESILQHKVQRVYLMRHLKAVRKRLPRKPYLQDNQQTCTAYHNAVTLLLATLKQK